MTTCQLLVSMNCTNGADEPASSAEHLADADAITLRVIMKPGLPPNRDPMQWLGMDKDGLVYVLIWNADGNCWQAMGYEFFKYHPGWLPRGIMCRQEFKDFIVAHWAVPENILTQISEPLKDARDYKPKPACPPTRHDYDRYKNEPLGGWID